VIIASKTRTIVTIIKAIPMIHDMLMNIDARNFSGSMVCGSGDGVEPVVIVDALGNKKADIPKGTRVTMQEKIDVKKTAGLTLAVKMICSSPIKLF